MSTGALGSANRGGVEDGCHVNGKSGSRWGDGGSKKISRVLSATYEIPPRKEQ